MELAPEWFAETIVSARPGYPFLIHEEALEIPWGKRRRKGQPLNLERPAFIFSKDLLTARSDPRASSNRFRAFVTDAKAGRTQKRDIL